MFGIFSALTSSFGSNGADDEPAKKQQPSPKSNGKCYKQQLNKDHVSSYLHPYRAAAGNQFSHSSLVMNAQTELVTPPMFIEQQAMDEMKATPPPPPPDCNELQFYGQLKKLLDLPVLFAICFVQLISFVLVLNIEECSPLVLFSWWRNKIS